MVVESSSPWERLNRWVLFYVFVVPFVGIKFYVQVALKFCGSFVSLYAFSLFNLPALDDLWLYDNFVKDTCFSLCVHSNSFTDRLWQKVEHRFCERAESQLPGMPSHFASRLRVSAAKDKRPRQVALFYERVYLLPGSELNHNHLACRVATFLQAARVSATKDKRLRQVACRRTYLYHDSFLWMFMLACYWLVLECLVKYCWGNFYQLARSTV